MKEWRLTIDVISVEVDSIVRPDVIGLVGNRRIMPHEISLEDHLAELLELFSSLIVGSRLGVGIYANDGEIQHQVGLSGFPRSIPSDMWETLTSEIGPKVHVSLALAFAKVESRASQRSLVFATCSHSVLHQSVLASLSRMGAGFLRRTLEQMEQAAALEQVVLEQRAIIDHMSDGLLVVDRNSILRFMNAPAGRILGVDPVANVGKPFRDVIDFEPFITPIFETKTGYFDRELRIQSLKVRAHIIDTAVPIFNDSGEVISIVNTFHEIARARQLSNRMAGDRARYRFQDIIGNAEKLQEAISIARRAARSDSNVLLYGESGTGKEMFAQSIHNESSRKDGPFVAVNCAALPRDLIESELFGYSAGSFTGADKNGRPGRFELAIGGTIFLDEISEMPLDVQVKLLRVLQERQVTRIGGATSTPIDVRVIAAANRNLVDLVSKAMFREDLFYRLNVLRVDLPSLRERKADIKPLAEQFALRACTLLHRPVLQFGPHAISQLTEYEWPGNIRQLQNIMERLVNLLDHSTIDSIPDDWLDSPKRKASNMPLSQGPMMSLEEAERLVIARTLLVCDDNVTKAADILGLSRPTLYAKVKRYGIGLELSERSLRRARVP